MSLQELLSAISEAFVTSRTEIILVVVSVVGLVLLLLISARLQRLLADRRADRALDERFERSIRKLDITVRQLDVLNLLATHLRDQSKKYLLLTNANTFQHCKRAHGTWEAPLDAACEALQSRLGFHDDSPVANDLSRFFPCVGATVKVESPHLPQRVVGSVTHADGRVLTLALDKNPGFSRSQAVLLYAVHASAIVTAEGEIEGLDGREMTVRVSRRFAEPASRHLADKALEAFVRSERGESDPQSTRIRSIWPGGAVLDNPDGQFRRRDDIQILFRRNHVKWVVVNAEVLRSRKRRRQITVRFSHLSREARQQVLGKTGPR